MIEGWHGAAEVSVEGARRLASGHEQQGLVAWVEGRFARGTAVEVR
jgi:hypothetical protein